MMKSFAGDGIYPRGSLYISMLHQKSPQFPWIEADNYFVAQSQTGARS